MNTGYLFADWDIAQIAIWLFWGFFAALIYYLHREDKREGYPLEDEFSTPYGLREGFPGIPKPKTFVLPHGGTRTVPKPWVPGKKELNAKPAYRGENAPLDPVGNPLLAGVGPGSWNNDRPDVPDLTHEGIPKLVPLRVARDYDIDSRDPDPRGKDVLGADGASGGKVVDAWVDRSEHIFRYLEVEAANGRRVLLPVNFTKVRGDGTVTVRAILGSQFGDVPGLANPDQVTLLEEEKVVAYYGAGTLYATADRKEPFL
jgi:photosynthetic reaction center H subunit